ncbi:COX17 isoform 6, partial [Pongo abelii]
GNDGDGGERQASTTHSFLQMCFEYLLWVKHCIRSEDVDMDKDGS